jgi:hypothetical protein
MSDLEARPEFLADLSIEHLVSEMKDLDKIEDPNQSERLALSWVREEIESRVPAVHKALKAAFYTAILKERRTGKYVDVNYSAVVLDALESAGYKV